MNVLRMAAAAALLVVAGTSATADCGACKPMGCGENVVGCCEPILVMQCCPEYKTEPIRKKCFDVECDHICIPPVKLPWHRCSGNHCNIGLFGGKGCGLFGGECCSSCGDEGCTGGCGATAGDGGCLAGNGCPDGGCGSKKGRLASLCSKLTDCQVKRVYTFKAREYECGERCVVTWKLHKSWINGCATGCCKSGDGCGCTSYGGCLPCGE